jgi:hypothetical protein
MNIKNAGKASIHASDYFEPLTFEFDTKVLQASVLETTPPTLINPSTLPTFLTLTPQSVQFPTFPLNADDSIQISILLEGKGTLKARGRLDQGTIVKLEPEKTEFIAVAVGTIGEVAVAVAIGAVLGALSVGAGTGAVVVVGVGVALALAGGTLVVLAAMRRTRRR